MEKQQVESTKTKRQYKKRKLYVPKADFLNEDSFENGRLSNNDSFRDPIARKHELKVEHNRSYRQRSGAAGELQDAWKRIKDRWVNEEQERKRVQKITKYFSITMQKHSREELLAKLVEEKEEEALAPPTEEALAPDEQP